MASIESQLFSYNNKEQLDEMTFIFHDITLSTKIGNFDTGHKFKYATIDFENSQLILGENDEKLNSLILDSDFVFGKDYFNTISELKGNFAAGAETYYWCNMEGPTSHWMNNRDFNYFRNNGGEPRSPIFKFRSMTRGCGFGAILVYNREWYWNVFGGYNENFFRYGWEDKAATETIKFLLNRTDETMDRIPYEAAHLSHFGKDGRNLNINEKLFYHFTAMNQRDLSNKIKKASVGKTDEPTLI